MNANSDTDTSLRQRAEMGDGAAESDYEQGFRAGWIAARREDGRVVDVKEYILTNFTPVPESGCWIWTGGWTTEGYGAVRRDGRWVMSAHKLFYSAFKGDIPPGMLVCHSCDTPACVNPDHLFLGTDSDNQLDRHRKGRRVVPFRVRKPVCNATQVCETCGVEFKARVGDVNRGKARYCGTECYGRRNTVPPAPVKQEGP